MIRILSDGDRIFATGVFLVKESTAPSGWVVDGFEDDSYHDGKLIETTQLESGENVFFTDSEEI